MGYSYPLWAAQVVVVLVEGVLEADREVALRRGQGVVPCRSDVVDACDAVNDHALEEVICLGNDCRDTCVPGAIGDI